MKTIVFGVIAAVLNLLLVSAPAHALTVGIDDWEYFDVDPTSARGITSWTLVPPSPLGTGIPNSSKAALLYFDSPFRLPSDPVTGQPVFEMTLDPDSVFRQAHLLDYRMIGDGRQADVGWWLYSDGVFLDEERPGDPRKLQGTLTVAFSDRHSQVSTDTYTQVADLHGYKTADALFASRPHGEPQAGVPEPASMLLFGGGMAFLAWTKRKRIAI